MWRLILIIPAQSLWMVAYGVGAKTTKVNWAMVRKHPEIIPLPS